MERLHLRPTMAILVKFGIFVRCIDGKSGTCSGPAASINQDSASQISRQQAAHWPQLFLLLQLQHTTGAMLGLILSSQDLLSPHSSIHLITIFELPIDCWRVTRSTSVSCRAAVRLFVSIHTWHCNPHHQIARRHKVLRRLHKRREAPSRESKRIRRGGESTNVCRLNGAAIPDVKVSQKTRAHLAFTSQNVQQGPSVYSVARSGESNLKISPIVAAIRVNKQLIDGSRF